MTLDEARAALIAECPMDHPADLHGAANYYRHVLCPRTGNVLCVLRDSDRGRLARTAAQRAVDAAAKEVIR